MFEPWALQIIMQIPIVGLFIWYNELREKRAREEREARDRDWRTWLDASEEARTKLSDEINLRMSGEIHRLSIAIEKLDKRS